MPYFSSTLLIIVIAVCALLIIVKLLKVEKGAVVLGLGVIVVWLALHFTGYDQTLNRIIFNAPSIQPATPDDLRNR